VEAGGPDLAEKRNEDDQDARVVVKKIKVTPEPGAPKVLERDSPTSQAAPQPRATPPGPPRQAQPQQPQPHQPQPQLAQQAVQRKVVAKMPVTVTRVVAPSPQPQQQQQAPPKQQPAQAPRPPPPAGPVVKRTVVKRQVVNGAEAAPRPEEPKRVERVVVREKAAAAAPASPDKLESGYNYLIEEPQPKRSFEFFKAKVGQGAKGLCISTSYPKKIVEEYGLHGTTVYWLSELEFDNQSLHPRRLDFEVTRAIQNFVKSNPSSLLIIDGVEFLILINGFERVMTFIKKMNDIMSATASTLITSINPSAFSEEKLSIIEREFDRVLRYMN
jgi:hypothetical protein